MNSSFQRDQTCQAVCTDL